MNRRAAGPAAASAAGPVVALVSVLVAGLLALLTPAGIGASVAAWTDTEWTNAAVGTETFTCGSDTGYATTASGTFLAATLAGLPVEDVAGLAGLTATRTGEAAAVTPATATHLDAGDADPTTDTWANPITVTALQTGLIDLTGLGAGLPLGSAGALSQYGQVTSLGRSAGASGLLNNSGGVGVTEGAADNTLPRPAELDLAAVLPPGVAAARLSVGAVAASSQLDWCSALESATWGDGTTSGVVRDYEIASLGLVVDSPVVGGLVTEVNAAVASMLAQSPGLNLGVGSPIQSLLGATLADAGLSIDLAAGTITVDLEPLLTDDLGLNDRAANTDLLLDATRVSAVIDRATALLTAWTTDVTAALTAVVPAILPTGGLLGPILSEANAALNVITRSLTSTVTTLTGTLATVLAGLGGGLDASLSALFAALPGVLTLTVNVQPDQTDAPPHPPYTAASPPDSSAEYRVSALRIGLLDGAAAGVELASVTLGTAAAGANARLP